MAKYSIVDLSMVPYSDGFGFWSGVLQDCVGRIMIVKVIVLVVVRVSP